MREPFVEQYESYGEVFEALSALPERDRTALYLHYYEGYTAREIAGMTGERERAVTKRIGRAREKMKKYLSEEVGRHEIEIYRGIRFAGIGR